MNDLCGNILLFYLFLLNKINYLSLSWKVNY